MVYTLSCTSFLDVSHLTGSKVNLKGFVLFVCWLVGQQDYKMGLSE